MVIGPIMKDPPPLLSFCSPAVEWVPVFKLLSIHVSSDLKWTKHIDAVVSKAASRLYFFKQFRRADVPTRDLLHFYTSVVWTVLVYACQVWHRGFITAHSDLLQLVLKRTIRIAYADVDYRTSFIVASIDTLDERREDLCWWRKSFRDTFSPAAQYCTAYSLIDETMTLLAACNIRNSFTQFKRLLINFVHSLYLTVSTITHTL